MTAEGQIKSFFQRWETLEVEKQQVADLMKDLFAEAKGFGYDTKALRAAFRLKAKQDLDSLADAEFEAIVDTYMSALNAPSVQARDARMRARENIEEFDPITGEFVDEPVNAKLVATVATGMQTETGRKALIAAVDIMIAREEAEEEFHTNPDEGAEAKGAATDDAEDRGEGDTDRQRSPEPGTTDGGRQGVREQEASAPVPAPNSEIDPTEDRKEDHSLDGNADASVGGRHVTAQKNSAASAGALVQVAPATKPLRPHCRNPGEHCGGYGSNHCHSCLRAAREPELEACT
ncbi:GapR family DNA-binding domain-containing protein [Rhizobium leguminosarum]